MVICNAAGELMAEIEDQRAGRNKATQIDKSYIESGTYRKKFDKITNSPEINRLLYQLAKKMLFHRAGTIFEDMYWIDTETGEIIASETKNDYDEEVKYSEATRRAIRNKHHLITIHSHPGSFPPSLNDFNSNYGHGYLLGIVVCHDGCIYIYDSEEPIGKYYYDVTIAGYLEKGYNELEAQKMALKEFSRKYAIHFKEVT